MTKNILEKGVQGVKRLGEKLYKNGRELSLSAFILLNAANLDAVNTPVQDQTKPIIEKVVPNDVNTNHEVCADLVDGDPVLGEKSVQEMTNELSTTGTLTLNIDGEDVSFSGFDSVNMPNEKTVFLADGSNPELDYSGRVKSFVNFDNGGSVILSTDGFLVGTLFADDGTSYTIKINNGEHKFQENEQPSQSASHEHHEGCTGAICPDIDDQKKRELAQKVENFMESAQDRSPVAGAQVMNIMYSDSGFSYLNDDPSLAAAHAAAVLAAHTSTITSIGGQSLEIYAQVIQLGGPVIDDTNPGVAFTQANDYLVANPVTPNPGTIVGSTLFFTDIDMVGADGISDAGVNIGPGFTIPNVCGLISTNAVGVVEIDASTDQNLNIHEGGPGGHKGTDGALDQGQGPGHTSNASGDIMSPIVNVSATYNAVETIPQLMQTISFSSNEPGCIHTSPVLPLEVIEDIRELDGSDCNNVSMHSEIKGFFDNVSYIQREYSTDGSSWENVGERIDCSGLQGEHTVRTDLDFPEGTSGKILTRFLVVDLDGSEEYSRIDIDNTAPCFEVKMYPNPVVDNNVSLDFSDLSDKLYYTTEISNMLGQVVASYSAKGGDIVDIDFSTVSAGLYTVTTSLLGNSIDNTPSEIIGTTKIVKN